MREITTSGASPTSQIQKFYGWKNVGFLFGVYLLSLGAVYYGFNVIFPEMVKTQGWSRGDASWAQTLRGLLMGFTAPLIAIALNRFGAQRTMAAGLSLLIVGCLLLATVTRELWQWTLIWGVIMATGFAFGGLLPVQTTITHWFDNKRATALGLVMSAAGVGGFVAQPFYTWIIDYFGSWQSSWYFSAGFAFIGSLLLLGLVNKPEDIGQHPDGEDRSNPSTVAQRPPPKTYKTQDDWSLPDAIRTRALWFIIILFLAQVMPLWLMIVHGVLHLTDLAFSKMEAASVLSFMVAGSAFARFPVGWLGDRIEPRRIVFVLALCSIFGLTIIWQAPTVAWLLIAGPMFGVAYGGVVVMLPTMIANYYGRASFATINGFIFPVQIVFAALLPVVAGYLADIQGHYDSSFIFVIILVGLSALCALGATPPRKKSEAGTVNQPDAD
ncbi:MAG TPA: hypothetical protein DCF62_03375 [Porticoccaceae bacterium]|nr:hypothetical protein [Porticoccaceae bacterium]